MHKMKLTALSLLLLPLAMAVPIKPTRTFNKRSLPRMGGVNLAGCDFGMQTDGSSGTPDCPGTEQIAHFINDGANVFRLPVGWQYLIGSTSSPANPSLDQSFWSTYDALVTAVTTAGAYAFIDVHNYARFNSAIIGQTGSSPTNQDFADLWSLIATQYKDNDKVMFGLMNEPHDLDIGEWATTCQAAVNAIRSAGATTQTIILPGEDWTHPDDWVNNDDSPMLSITDPATGDNSLLILDVHQYLDSDDSGTQSTCTTNAVDSLTSMASFLTTNNRQAFLSEIGAPDNSACITDLSQALQYVSESASDVFVGFTAWAAGSFSTDYLLSLTPSGDGTNTPFTDNAVFVSAVQPYLPGSTGGTSGSIVTTVPTTSTTATATTLTTATTVAVTTTTAGSSLERQSSISSSSSVPSSSLSKSTSASTSGPSGQVAIASAKTSSSSLKPSSTPSSSLKPSSTPSSSQVCAAKSSPTTSWAATTSEAATTTTSSTAASATGTNLQQYTEGLGNIYAPAVYKVSDTSYVIGSQSWNSLEAALDASCYDQMNSCQLAANQAGNTGNFTVWDCETPQIQACLAQALSTAANSSSA